MKGVFSFDAPLYRDINGVYCNTTITDEVLNRYLNFVDVLYLIMRTEDINTTYIEAHYSKIDTSRIHVIGLPNFNSPRNFFKRGYYKNILREYVSQSELFFLRMPSVTSDIIASLCKEMGKPYMVEVGGCAWDSFWNHGLVGKMVAPYMFFCARRTIKNASYATYVTTMWLQQRYPCNCESISASNVYLNGFDESVIDDRLKRYKEDPKPKKIGTIAGVDVRYKGQEYIIKALAFLKAKGIRLEYEMVGRGQPVYLKNLAMKHGVLDQVRFNGVMVHSDIWKWLDTIDIYAQPSKQEGLPRAVIESMNRGCLTVGSTTAGIPELLEDDMVFKNGDVKAIVDIITKLYNENNHEERVLRNFNKSKEYDINILNQRRTEYFKRYRDSVRENA